MSKEQLFCESLKEFTYPLAYLIGDRVRYKNKIGKDEGFITNLSIRQTGVMYGVTWSDKRELHHCDFELELMD